MIFKSVDLPVEVLKALHHSRYMACPSYSVCCIRFTSLCKNLFNLLEFLPEVFRCHVHHFQCLTVPVELAAMFRFIVVEMAEMLVCLIVSKSV